jgi:hypothetical protein
MNERDFVDTTPPEVPTLFDLLRIKGLTLRRSNC